MCLCVCLWALLLDSNKYITNIHLKWSYGQRCYSAVAVMKIIYENVCVAQTGTLLSDHLKLHLHDRLRTGNARQGLCKTGLLTIAIFTLQQYYYYHHDVVRKVQT